MTEYQTVNYKVVNRVATITLNRPQARNAFDTQLRLDLMAAVQRAIYDNDVRVVVLTGAGKIFCSGADLREVSDHLYAKTTQEQIEDEYKPILMAIENAKKPFISAVNGVAAGIGSAFAMVCDLMVMADNASLYQAFSAIGLVPDGGVSWHLVNTLGHKRAYQTFIEAEKITADKCLELGLANKVVEAQTLLVDVQCWAEHIAEKAPLALGYGKHIMYKAMAFDLGQTISLEAEIQNIITAGHDAREGGMAFIEKRRPQFLGK